MRIRPSRRRKFWTPERIIEGLRRFHADFGFCAPSSKRYAEHAEFSSRANIGRFSTQGHLQRYPSFATILGTYGSMREAWRAAGFDIDNGYMEWSEMEDWFVLESAGLLPRTEVAAYIGRTVPAVKRRLYDLGGILAKRRWGFSISFTAGLLGLSEAIIQRQLQTGKIPYMAGWKTIYINPADILLIDGVDWKTIELPQPVDVLVRRSIAQRIAKIARHGTEWRKHEIYKYQQTVKPSARYKKKRQPALKKFPAPEPPNNIAVGDWVKTVQSALGVAGRIGVVKAVHFSPTVSERRDGTCRRCWVARVEFPRLRSTAHSNDVRLHYSLPLDALIRTDAPVIEKKPLSTNPEAVRSRSRYSTAQRRARDRFAEIKGGLS